MQVSRVGDPWQGCLSVAQAAMEEDGTGVSRPVTDTPVLHGNSALAITG